MKYTKFQQGDVLMLKIDNIKHMMENYKSFIKNNTNNKTYSIKNPSESYITTHNSSIVSW